MQHHQKIIEQLRQETGLVLFHLRRQNRKLRAPIEPTIDKNKKRPIVFERDIPREFKGRTGRFIKKIIHDLREIKAFGQTLIDAHAKRDNR